MLFDFGYNLISGFAKNTDLSNDFFKDETRSTLVVNVWLPCPSHAVAPAILQSLIVPLCSPRGCCVVLAVSECSTAKCSFSAVWPPWEAFDQLRCCVCFRVSLLACSAPWLSGVLNELKPGFLQIVFSRIRRREHENPRARKLQQNGRKCHATITGKRNQ